MTEDLYSILLTNSLKLFSQGLPFKEKNTDLDVSQFFGIFVRSDTYKYCTIVSSNTKQINPSYTSLLSNEEKVRKDVINITLNSKFPDKDKILIRLFDNSGIVTLIESKVLSRDNFIKIWNILFKNILDDYKIGAYYD